MSEFTDRNTSNPDAWMTKARADLDGAADLRSTGKPYLDLIAYHLQQGVEKALKAVLVARSVEPPRTHVVSTILTAVAEIGVDVPREFAAAARLSVYATMTRYPGSDELPSEEELTVHFGLARRIVDWAESVIGSSGDVG